MQLKSTLLAGAAIVAPAGAADLKLSIELPKLAIAEYHKPYVAVWIESNDQKFVDNLTVWYDLKKRDNAGAKWLKDMRTWWRKSGRDLTLPVDGVSAATRAPGEHQINFSSNTGALARLAPGSYQLVVEAAREAGGRELLRIPFTWPAKTAQSGQVKGESELGKVAFNLQP
jgi:hypothetical protein